MATAEQTNPYEGAIAVTASNPYEGALQVNEAVTPPPQQESSFFGTVEEDDLKKDPEWIKAARNIYEWNEGRTLEYDQGELTEGKKEVPKLNSDEQYANYALRYMGWFNYNIPKMANEVLDLQTATDQQKTDFVKLMDMYDTKKISASGVGRFIQGVGLDPSTYVGIGTFGAGLAAREATKQAAKQSVKQMIISGVKRGAPIAATEGAIYTGVDDALRQEARIEAGQQEGHDFVQSLKAIALGATIGGALGGTVGGLSGKVKGTKIQKASEAEQVKADVKTPEQEEPTIRETSNPQGQTIPVETVIKRFQKDDPAKIKFNKFVADNGIYLQNKMQKSLDQSLSITDPKKATEFAKNAIREIETDITNKFSKIKKPKSNAKPQILKRVTVPKPRMLKDLVKNIDPEMSGMSELIRVVSAKSGKLPSWRMAKGGIKDYEEIYQNAVEEGFYPERAYRSDSPDIGMPQNFIDDIADKIHPEDIEGYDNAINKNNEIDEIELKLEQNNINPKGMTDEEVIQVINDIDSGMLNVTRSDIPAKEAARLEKELIDEIESQQGSAQIDDSGRPIQGGPITPDFQRDTTVNLNDRLVEVGIKIMDDLKIPRDPNVRISDQLEDVLFKAETNPVAREELEPVLKRNNITLPELSKLFRESIADSARRMQKLSAVSRAIENLSEKIGEIAKPETWTSNLYNFIKQADNIRRGLLVSQIATAMRNNTAQQGRVVMKTLIDVFDNTLKQTFNPLRRAFGSQETPVNYARAFELILNLTTKRKQAKDLTDLLTKYYVKDAENLFTRYSSDVADATQTSNAARVIKVGQKVTDGLNVLNRMQEFWFRRAVFANTITDTLLKKGIDINKVGISNDLFKNISKVDIEKAVDDALYFTYAKTPDVPIIKHLVDAVNSSPFLLTGVIPFPRFMANAIAFQFRHSPLGFSALLFPKEIAKLKAGNYKTLGQAVVGTTLLLTMVEAKRRGLGKDHKWYEVETPSGKTIDMRPYFPLTPYLFLADVITRVESGRDWGNAKDILQALSGAQFRAGASLQLVQNAIDGMAGLDTKEKINKYMSDYTSNVLGGYLTPLRMFGDFIDATRYYLDEDFEGQKFRRPVETGEFTTDTLNKLKTSVPIVREQFPEIQSPTREATPGRPETVTIPFTDIQAPGPLTRQLTGATVREEKNAAEREFDRLGFRRRDILPYSGNQQVDQIRSQYLGPIVEKVIGKLVQQESYLKASNELKGYILRDTLKAIRSTANDYIKEQRIEPELFMKVYTNRLPKYVKRLLAGENVNLNAIRTDLLNQ